MKENTVTSSWTIKMSQWVKMLCSSLTTWVPCLGHMQAVPWPPCAHLRMTLDSSSSHFYPQVLEYKDSRLEVYVPSCPVWITSQTLQTWCLSVKFLYSSHSVAGIVFISCPGRIGSWRNRLVSESQSSQCLSNLMTALREPGWDTQKADVFQWFLHPSVF